MLISEAVIDNILCIILHIILILVQQLLRSVHTRRQVAATCRGDKLQRQIASCGLENFAKIFDAATEFCRLNKAHRFSLI